MSNAPNYAEKSERGYVRIQLQEANNHLWDGKPKSISATDTIDVLNRLYHEKRKYINDPKWEKALVPAIHKLTGLIISARNSGGMKPRGSGNQLRTTFKYANKEYRIDLEIHGSDDIDFFT